MNLQMCVYFSMVLRKAACASEVSESASSRKIILNVDFPMGAVRAKSFIFPRIMPIPRSSDALSSWKFCFHVSFSNSSLASAIADVVFPVPAGPANIRCGTFFVFA